MTYSLVNEIGVEVIFKGRESGLGIPVLENPVKFDYEAFECLLKIN